MRERDCVSCVPWREELNYHQFATLESKTTKSVILFLCVACATTCFGQHYLNKVHPVVPTDDRGHGFFYETVVPLHTANALSKWLAGHGHSPVIPTFYAVPGTKFLLASDAQPASNGDKLGIAFFTITGDSVTEVFADFPLDLDCLIPHLTFFYNKERTFILATFGNEDYDYGFLAAECCHDSVRTLGLTEMSTEDPEGGYGCPDTDLNVRFERGTTSERRADERRDAILQ